jgi:hypothetical protein
MNPTVKRLTALAAVGTAIGIVAPVASADAATPPVPAGLAFPLPHFPIHGVTGFTAGLTGFTPGLAGFGPGGPVGLVGPNIAPSTGVVATVIGPNVITTAPSAFINTNIQVSAGGNFSGGQVGP